MKKFFCVLAFLLMQGNCWSQSVQQEINDQIWKVQLEAMNEYDPDKFMSVMSDDVIQISYDRSVIRNKAEFKEQVVKTYSRSKDNGLTRKMEFRFLNRVANGTLGFEDGFFKYEIINRNLERRVFYGYFQVTLRKEADTWRVLVDYDAEKYHGAPVTPEMFDQARALDSF
jgi:ketosteroid isomerase-like protein